MSHSSANSKRLQKSPENGFRDVSRDHILACAIALGSFFILEQEPTQPDIFLEATHDVAGIADVLDANPLLETTEPTKLFVDPTLIQNPIILDPLTSESELSYERATTTHADSFKKQNASLITYWNHDHEHTPKQALTSVTQHIRLSHLDTSSQIHIENETPYTVYTHGVFNAMQFELRAEDDPEDMLGGYLGIQSRTKINNQLPGAIFSIWEANGAHAAINGTASYFDHEGVGYSTSIPLETIYQNDYKLELVRAIDVEGALFEQDGLIIYQAYVTVDGERQIIGSIEVPARYNQIHDSANFVEQYTEDHGDCKNISQVTSLFAAPSYRYDNSVEPIIPDRVVAIDETYPDCPSIGTSTFDPRSNVATIELG